MGNNQAGCSLDAMTNVCHMHQCLKEIKGRASSSTSPSDIWIGALKENTTFRSTPVKCVCMKISINESSVPKQLMADYTRLQCMGLKYELRVYNQIVTPILDALICPNFLRSYLVSTDCDYAALAMTVEAHVANPHQIRNLNRNLGYMMHGLGNRPAIDDSTISEGVPPLGQVGTKYMVLSTEYTNVVTYFDWLEEVEGMDEKRRNSAECVAARQCVLLQIAIALYVMEKAKLLHYDLHANNIFIQKLDRVETWTYRIHGRVITVRTRFKAMIFDFDRAVCPTLGPNELSRYIYGDYCGFQENRDIVTLYAYLQLEPILLKLSLMDSFFKVAIPPGTDLLADWYRQPGTCLQSSIWNGITLLAHRLGSGDRSVDLGTVYTIHHHMFSRDGVLLPKLAPFVRKHAERARRQAHPFNKP